MAENLDNANDLSKILKDILKTQQQINEERAADLSITRDINNEIRESLKGVGKDLDFKQAIRKTLGEINKLSEQSFNFSKEELSISLDKENISKRTKKLTESIISAKRESEFVDRRISELSNEIQEGKDKENKLIQNQIDSFKKVKQGLNSIVEESKTYSKNLKQAKELQNELGKVVTPKGFEALSDITSQIPGLRKLSGPFQEASKASKNVAARMTKINIMGKELNGKVRFSKAQIGLKSLTSGFKALGGVIMKAITPLAIAKVLIDIAKFFVDAMFKASKATADFSRNLLISRDAARELYSETIPGIVNEYNSIAKSQKEISITAADYEKTLGDINKQLGLQLNLSQDFGKSTAQNVAEAAMMQKQFGLSAEATTRLFLDAERTNKPLKEMTKEIFGQLAIQGNNAGLMADMNESIEQAAKISGNLRANFRGSTADIASAVFQAKMLGLTLQQTEGIANSLLSFESSIAAEMEAELLTGRQLNLEQARYNALMGDTDGLLEELNKQNLTQTEFLDMNIIQRKALAKALGMEINEMADMFQQQADQNALAQKQLSLERELRKANIVLAKDENGRITSGLSEIQRAMKATGKTEKEIRETLGGQVYMRKQSEDAQQKFNKSLEQAKEAFSRLVDGGALDGLADILTGITESALFAGFKEEGEARRLSEQAAEKVESGEITQQQQDIINSNKEFISSTSGLMGQIKSYMKGVVSVGGNPLLGIMAGIDQISIDKQRREEKLKESKNILGYNINDGAVISTNSNDFVIAGTSKGGNEKLADRLSGGGETISTQKTEQLLERLIMAVEKGQSTTISVDGNRLNTAVAMNTSKFGA